MTDGVFVYSFVAWPSETWGFNHSVIDLFERIKCRVEVEITEQGFERYRSELNHHGITLREIERVPYHAPEGVT